MNTIRVSATHARNNFFELLDQVAAGRSLIIEKDKMAIAQLIPHVIEKRKNKGLLKALDKAAKGFRYSTKDNPLRRSGAKNFLGNWDKDLVRIKDK